VRVKQGNYGNGGFGEVYLGRSASGQPVAVKICDASNAAVRKYLHQEIKVSKSLDHPNVIKILYHEVRGADLPTHCEIPTRDFSSLLLLFCLEQILLLKQIPK